MSLTQNTGSTATTTTSVPVPDLAAISVSAKIPEFWKDMPRLWFAQFDSIMEPQKQGDLAKFNMVIAKLSREALQQVCDLIITPPAERKYESIKERLITAYEESAERQFHKLVSEMDLGTQRPSQLLRRMSEFASNTQVSTEALRRLWISRLPNAVKAVLSVAQDTKLEGLAAMADKIMENLQTSEVAAVSSTPTPNIPEVMNQFTQMAIELKHLRNEISEIRETRGRSRSPGNAWNYRNRSQSRFSRPRAAPRTPTSPNWLCRYHFRYRNRAMNCEQPCNWRQPSAGGSQGQTTSRGQAQNMRNSEN